MAHRCVRIVWTPEARSLIMAMGLNKPEKWQCQFGEPWKLCSFGVTKTEFEPGKRGSFSVNPKSNRMGAQSKCPVLYLYSRKPHKV